MAKTVKNPFKNSKLKAFIVFLFLSFCFLDVNQSSQNQMLPLLVATISYVNIPQGYMLDENTIQDFSFNVNATRFEFLGYVFQKAEYKN